jgi:L-ornithine N5-monooxygenase
MPVAGTTSTYQQIVAESVRTPITRIVEYLQKHVGKTLTAYVSGGERSDAIESWLRGTTVPEPSAIPRLRHAYLAVRLVSEMFGDETAAAWLFGIKAELGDEAPAAVLRHGDDLERVVTAARSFVEGSGQGGVRDSRDPLEGQETADSSRPYDLVGVGFGPANMSLAVLLQEEAEQGGHDVRRLFLEARSEPVWHPDLLLEDSQIQVIALKDLATVRNPRSRFTFLCYLQERGRLFEFLNLRDPYPGRIEFNDYLRWVEKQLSRDVRCGQRVEAIEPVIGGGATSDDRVELLRVTSRDAATGEARSILTKDAVIATGGQPWVPPGIELREDGRAFHASDLLMRLDRDFLDRDAPYFFIVIGAGQTAAEQFLYLLRRFPNADVTATMRRFGYKPRDESDFTSRTFFPEMVDWIYELPDGLREEVVDSFRDINYSVVDTRLIKKINRFLYDEKVVGRNRARILPYLQLTAVRDEGDRAVAEMHHVLHPDRRQEFAGDAVILSTGYDRSSQHPLLEPLAPWLVPTANSTGWEVNRDYSLATRKGFEPRVYLQGFCESTHGIGDTVPALLPIRAQDIWHSLVERITHIRRPSIQHLSAT